MTKKHHVRNPIHHYPQDTVEDDVMDQIGASLLCTQPRDMVGAPDPRPQGVPASFILDSPALHSLKGQRCQDSFQLVTGKSACQISPKLNFASAFGSLIKTILLKWIYFSQKVWSGSVPVYTVLNYW